MKNCLILSCQHCMLFEKVLILRVRLYLWRVIPFCGEVQPNHSTFCCHLQFPIPHAILATSVRICNGRWWRKKNFFQSCMEPRTNSRTFSWREPVLKLRHLSIIACIFCVLAGERTHTHTYTHLCFSLPSHFIIFYPPQVRFDLRKIEGRRQLSKEINAKSGKFTFVGVRTWTADEGRHLQSKVKTMVILF